jgi:hypothetical protein
MKTKMFMVALAMSLSFVTVKASAQPRPPRPQVDNVYCSSRGYGYSECPSRYVRRIEHISLLRQYSHTRCDYGYTYGVRQTPYGDTVWVDRGCEADFRIYGR